ncbi:MAG: hypothetical protein LBI10_00625 [Deltaproteobacteria bacterium]|jgi:hypothetical protein|nr:hypothetical protein [Deltaproteobacteria bacterium]
MKKRAIKLILLLAGLATLVWWGWIGNFSLKSGSFYPFGPREDYYALMAGQKNLGYARREVALAPDKKNLTLTEDFVINLSVLVAEGEIRCQSKAEFTSKGDFLSSRLGLGLGLGAKPLAEVRSEVKDGQLTYWIEVGDKRRTAAKPVPETGPIMISGLLPWLARQRDLPLGRPIFFSLFDPSRLEFRPASLTIIDVTAQAVEKKVYKLAVFLDPFQTEIWIDADGKVLSQKSTDLEFGVVAIENPQVLTEAKNILGSPPKPGFLNHLPKVLLDMIVSQGVGALWPEDK